jgi:hypothetical protein
MKTATALCIVLAGAAFVALRPAAACPNVAEIGPTASVAAATASAQPASRYPIPGFDQMLAAREPAPSAHVSTAHRDVLLPYFQAMLWSKPVADRTPPVAHAQVARTGVTQ